MPVLSMCICLAIVDAACDTIDLSGMLNGIKKNRNMGTWTYNGNFYRSFIYTKYRRFVG